MKSKVKYMLSMQLFIRSVAYLEDNQKFVALASDVTFYSKVAFREAYKKFVGG